MARLEGKVALVTGGLSGIGRQIARALADEGARVMVSDVREASRDDDASGDAVAEGIGGAFVRADVTQAADVDAAVTATVDAFGGLDVLVTSAGVALFKPIEDIAPEEFDHVMAVNVRGTFLACQRAIAQMRRDGRRGSIVNVASNFAFVAAPEATLYCASKGAVATMTKGLALEAAPYGIRVNALCPGATATEFNAAHRTRQEVVEDWRSKTPLDLGREQFLALPEEIAPSALFLASDDSRYMTGANLVVDGGWNAQ